MPEAVLLRFVPFLVLSACAWFDKAEDTVSGIFEPVVAVSVLTFVDLPETDAVDLEDLDLEVGLNGTAFLALTTSIDDLEDALIDDATLTARGCGQEGAFTNFDGAYVLVAPHEADGCQGPEVVVSWDDAAEPVDLPVMLPGPIQAVVPLTWTANTPLDVDLSSDGFDSVFVIVVDVISGEVTYSNEPEGVGEWYRFLTGTGDASSVQIPADAFQADTTHAVAINGLVKTPNRDITGANTVLSVVAGGRTRVYSVTTGTP